MFIYVLGLYHILWKKRKMATPNSTCRRKPSFTYRSPTANEDPNVPWILRFPRPHSRVSSSGTSPVMNHLNSPRSAHMRFVNTAPLSLYHSLGVLAKRLPPLDPTIFGFPPPEVPNEEEVEEEVVEETAAAPSNEEIDAMFGARL